MTNVKGKSLKTVKSGAMLLKLPIGFGGRRLLTKRFASTSRNKRINPNMRVAQANPTVGNSLCSSSGKMIPPMDPEVMAIPVALPRLRRKKWPMEAMQGVFIRQPPTVQSKSTLKRDHKVSNC